MPFITITLIATVSGTCLPHRTTTAPQIEAVIWLKFKKHPHQFYLIVVNVLPICGQWQFSPWLVPLVEKQRTTRSMPPSNLRWTSNFRENGCSILAVQNNVTTLSGFFPLTPLDLVRAFLLKLKLAPSPHPHQPFPILSLGPT